MVLSTKNAFAILRRFILGGTLADVFDSVRLADDFGDSYAEPFVDHDYFAFAKQLVVDKDFHRFAGRFVQLDHRP